MYVCGWYKQRQSKRGKMMLSCTENDQDASPERDNTIILGEG